MACGSEFISLTWIWKKYTQQRRVHRSERQAKLKVQILWNECAVCNVVVVLFKPPIPSFIHSLFFHSFVNYLYDKKTKSVYFVITDDVIDTSSSCYVYRCTDNVVIETKYCREKTFAPSPQFFFLKNKKKPRWLRKVFDMIHESCTKLNDTRKRSNKLVWSYANYSCVATFYRPQRSCEGYVFTGVCLSTGGCLVSVYRGGCLVPGGLVSQHALRQNPPPPPGETGVPGSRGGGVGIPACTEADPPRERRLLLRTVRILLECILVVFFCIWAKATSLPNGVIENPI